MHIPHLYRNRHGTYYVRVTENKRTVKRTLGTKEPRVARLKALAFNLVLEMSKPKLSDVNFDDIKKLDVVLPNGVELRGIHSDEDMQRAAQLLRAYAPSAPLGPPTTVSPQKVITPKADRISAVVDEYFAEISKVKSNVQKTIDEKRQVYADFIDCLGDEPINLFTDKNAVQFKNRLVGQQFSNNRITKKLSAMRVLFDWARDNAKLDADAPNPFAKVKIAKKKDLVEQTEHYEAFTTKELAKIFDATNYEQMYFDARTKKVRRSIPQYFWLPIMGLYTGARIEELCSLKIAQVLEEDGIHFFNIIKAVSAKTHTSVRKIPVHKTLISLGFLDYVERIRNAGEAQLFPSLTKTKNGFSKNVSARFGAYLSALGIDSPLKVFHSLRYNMIDRLTNLHCHPTIVMGIVGHYKQELIDTRSAHSSTYLHAKRPLEVLKETIDMFDVSINPGALPPLTVSQKKDRHGRGAH